MTDKNDVDACSHVGLQDSLMRGALRQLRQIRRYVPTSTFQKLVVALVHSQLAVWLSGNTLASINVVALRQTRLVLGWVTVCGRVNHLGM